MKYAFKGNLPKDENAKDFYLKSGLMKYVRSKKVAMPTPSDEVKIISGKTTDTEAVKSMCDFVVDPTIKTIVGGH